jgi:hypothetical protein
VRDALAVVAEPAVDALLRGSAVAFRTAEAPFAEAAGRVAERLQQARQRDGSGFERMLAFRLDFPVVADLCMAGVQAGHQDAPRRSTDGVARVALREAHSVFGDLVNVGRADFGLAEGADIAVAQIVGKEEHDVGAVGGE